MSQLLALDLASNNLSGTISASLASMPQLQELDLSHNDLQGTLPTDWSGAQDLILLYLQGNQLSGKSLSALPKAHGEHTPVMQQLPSTACQPLSLGARRTDPRPAL